MSEATYREDGRYRVVELDGYYRVMEVFGSYRMLKKKYRSRAAAVVRMGQMP